MSPPLPGWAVPPNLPTPTAHCFAPGSWDSLCEQVWLGPSARDTLGPRPPGDERNVCVQCDRLLARLKGDPS